MFKRSFVLYFRAFGKYLKMEICILVYDIGFVVWSPTDPDAVCAIMIIIIAK